MSASEPAAKPRLRIKAAVGTSLQDRGRPGWGQAAVPPAGAQDPYYLAAANLLLGNPPDLAAVEIGLGWVEFTPLDQALALAWAGTHIEVRQQNPAGSMRKLSPWSSQTLPTGACLRIRRLAGEAAYVAVGGGFALPEILGSRSFYGLAGLGTEILSNAAAPEGVILPCLGRDPAPAPAPAPVGNEANMFRADLFRADLFRASAAWLYPPGPIRVVAGPHHDWFDAASLSRFYHTIWTKAAASNRMGIRLSASPAGAAGEGAAGENRLTRRAARSGEILSQGVVAGAIQVPNDGNPIILGQDAQTTGGYPVIACVITADLPRLAHLAVGGSLGFQAVNLAEALAAHHQREADFAAWRQNLRRVAMGADGDNTANAAIDRHALYAENLISGVVSND
ncbi:MAG: biotin-dependent carboxyltransferase family protein [Candidatus Symbiobacter sp.]|nr:biotin-dependent carboxyltransferase family protein [Candidatus Symbiobacter sp.]